MPHHPTTLFLLPGRERGQNQALGRVPTRRSGSCVRTAPPPYLPEEVGEHRVG